MFPSRLLPHCQNESSLRARPFIRTVSTTQINHTNQTYFSYEGFVRFETEPVQGNSDKAY